MSEREKALTVRKTSTGRSYSVNHHVTCEHPGCDSQAGISQFVFDQNTHMCFVCTGNITNINHVRVIPHHYHHSDDPSIYDTDHTHALCHEQCAAEGLRLYYLKRLRA